MPQANKVERDSWPDSYPSAEIDATGELFVHTLVRLEWVADADPQFRIPQESRGRPVTRGNRRETGGTREPLQHTGSRAICFVASGF